MSNVFASGMNVNVSIHSPAENNASPIQITVLPPKDGAPGYTPEKGKDYFTSSDKEEIVKEVIDTLLEGGGPGGITQETDPTVPAWAKQPEKPKYTADEVGAQPKGDYALKSEIPPVPVQSVNGKTGKVELSAADVGALPKDTQIPAPYTLPTASADTKGGVKVGEGLQMDGDVLGVKPEGVYELIETITTTEEIRTISRTAEPDGTQYKFDACLVEVITSNNGVSDGAVYFKAFMRNGTQIVGYAIANAVKKSEERHVLYKVETRKGMYETDITDAGMTKFSLTGLKRQPSIVKANDKIGKIEVQVFTSGVPFPDGTIVKIWGVRADA